MALSGEAQRPLRRPRTGAAGCLDADWPNAARIDSASGKRLARRWKNMATARYPSPEAGGLLIVRCAYH